MIKQLSNYNESISTMTEPNKSLSNTFNKRLVQSKNKKDLINQIEDDNNLSVNITTEADLSDYHYYFLSEKPNLVILTPNVDNIKKYEDSKTNRISFYNTIDKALMSNTNIKGKEYYVYVPIRIDKLKLIKPAINQVPTINITGEYWVTEPIRVQCAGKIKVLDNTNKSHLYKLGNTLSELYEWNYRNIVDESNLIQAGDSKPANKNLATKPYKYDLVVQDLKPKIDLTNEQFKIIEQAQYTNSKCYPVFIILQDNGTILGSLIKFMTGDSYSHASISFNSALDPMYSFGNRNPSQINIDLNLTIMNPSNEFYQKFGISYAVYVIYVNKKFIDAIKNTLNIFSENKDNLKYDFLNLFKIWFNVASEDSPKYFCSKFIAKIIDIGYKLGRVPSLFKPNDFNDLQNVSLVNKGIHLRDYNKKITLANLERIKNGTYTEYSEDISILNKNIKEQQEIINQEYNPKKDIFIPEKKDSLIDILDKTPLNRIYLTSDWHLFKNHYKREQNLVNTKEIIKWCQNNIKNDDVFFYLGDISYRYANRQDQLTTKQIMSSIPGIKVLILGNHDIELGQQYFKDCGFNYVMEEFEWDRYKLIFSHRPLKMIYDQDKLNIHGHMHHEVTYRTSNGQHHLNVYPYFYNNKPVSLQYLLDNKDKLIKTHIWVPNYGYGESFIPMNKYLKPFLEVDKSSINNILKSYMEMLNRPEQSTLYFTREISAKSIAKLVSRFKNRLSGKVAIKIHFGETGNENYLNPKLLKETIKLFDDCALVDCNTAYKGSKRMDTESHINVAKNHGFSDIANIDILDSDDEISLSISSFNKIQSELQNIRDGKKKSYESFVTLGEHLKEIHIGSKLANYDSMLVYTHVKGHTIAGFGGSIKNIGMGLASGKSGKLQIHGKDFEIIGHLFHERLAESASAICDYFEDNIVYVNIIANISLECDCHSNVKAKDKIMPDIGVLCGTDIVAIDKASLDLIRYNQKAISLMDQIANKGGHHIIEYANNLNIGNSEYQIYDIDKNKLITKDYNFINEYIYR